MASTTIHTADETDVVVSNTSMSDHQKRQRNINNCNSSLGDLHNDIVS